MKIYKYILLLLATIGLSFASNMQAEEPCEEVVVKKTVTGIDSVSYGGKTYYDNVTFSHINVMENGCDSITIISIVVANTPLPEEDPAIYGLLINKYNYILLVNEAKLQQLYPNQEATGIRWYHNGAIMSDITTMFYSTNNGLNGSYYVELDIAGKTVRSETIEVLRDNP